MMISVWPTQVVGLVTYAMMCPNCESTAIPVGHRTTEMELLFHWKKALGKERALHRQGQMDGLWVPCDMSRCTSNVEIHEYDHPNIIYRKVWKTGAPVTVHLRITSQAKIWGVWARPIVSYSFTSDSHVRQNVWGNLHTTTYYFSQLQIYIYLFSFPDLFLILKNLVQLSLTHWWNPL